MTDIAKLEVETEKKETRGGKRAGAGRKQKYEGGRKQLSISCSAEQIEILSKAAESCGVTITDYILEKCGILHK